MTPEARATLDTAWSDRRIQWDAGTVLIHEGDAIWTEVKKLPGSVRISVWYAISESSCEAAEKVYNGYRLRTDADRLWHDAVAVICGMNTKVSWEYNDAAKGYDCKLETGEIFKA